MRLVVALEADAPDELGVRLGAAKQGGKGVCADERLVCLDERAVSHPSMACIPRRTVSLLSGSSCMMASTPRVQHSFATSLWRVTATRFANNPSQALVAWAMSGAPSRSAISLFDPKRVLRPDAMMMQPCTASGFQRGWSWSVRLCRFDGRSVGFGMRGFRRIPRPQYNMYVSINLKQRGAPLLPFRNTFARKACKRLGS